MSAGKNCKSIRECINLGCCWCLENNFRFRESISRVGYKFFTNILVLAANMLDLHRNKGRENCLKYLIKYGATAPELVGHREYFVSGIIGFLKIFISNHNLDIPNHRNIVDLIIDIVLKCENEKHGEYDINDSVFIINEENGREDEINLLSSLIRASTRIQNIEFLIDLGARMNNDEMYTRTMYAVRNSMPDDTYIIYETKIQELLSSNLSEEDKYPG